ncbi:GNAT family N-acetyltransferase [Methylobacterium sp. NEAU 140]|uniref:GNAT family N-acetyltransferase n=1 Tax=Methylobacterium sp. NEAU 140 TaxID=3064945 RepID=UPI002734596E|nr:GNAT family N-acetyltransferase [Methylobacterium sp. NEAU 140]MDP4025286.1 GNAT family N-acetyltransferase [Methylobacterium sp. NEAU 140]
MSPVDRAAAGRAARAEARHAVRTEIVDPSAFLACEAAFRALADAAPETNAFLEPAVLDAAQRADPSVPIVVLLAWDAAPEGRLVGAWAFARRGGALGRLHAPAVPLGTLAVPVIRAGWAEAVLAEWFARVAADPRLPKVLELDTVDDAGPVGAALDRMVAARRISRRVVARRRRPMLASDLAPDAYLKQAISGSRRSKLRQLRAKLGRQGDLRHVVHEGEAVAAATAQFLDLEAQGWKGRRGTAMLADPRVDAFVRAALVALAGRGLAAVSALTLDGRPVSMCLLLRSGGTAFTWKIAYDEAFGSCSPGYQLALDDTAALLTDPAVARTDSCASDETGIMAGLWRERADTSDVFLGARPGRSVRFEAAMAALMAARLVPEVRRRLRLRTRLKPLLRALRVRRQG